MSINRNQPQRTEIKWNVPQCELKSTSLSRISCRIIRLKCSANHFSCPTWPQSTYTQPESVPDSFNTHGKDELAEPPPMGTALEGAVRDNMYTDAQILLKAPPEAPASTPHPDPSEP